MTELGIPNRIDVRLHSMKAVDAIIAALQTTFAQENLLNGGNPFLFNREDVKSSKLWICAPGGREGYDRSGARMIIVVSRGSCVPMNMHLHNRAQGSWNEPVKHSDLYQTSIKISCEAGLSEQSEALASISAQILKYFREDLMAEFDIHEIEVRAIDTPIHLEGATGEPWQTSVQVQVQTQEMYAVATHMNQLNKLELVTQFKKAAIALDTSLNPFISIAPQNAVTENSIDFVSTLSVTTWPKPITFQWSKFSGPGGIMFGAPTAAATMATFSAPGDYVVQCTATDGDFTIAGQTTVTVASP